MVINTKPRLGHQGLEIEMAFTQQNTDGYTDAQLAALNAEMAQRLDGLEAEKAFHDEVATRPGFGEVQHEGKTITLTQQPYLHADTYRASGVDAAGDLYQVDWAITNPDAEDESDACDWNDYTVQHIGSNLD